MGRLNVTILSSLVYGKRLRVISDGDVAPSPQRRNAMKLVIVASGRGTRIAEESVSSDARCRTQQ